MPLYMPDPLNKVFLPSDVTNATTSFADITALSFPVVSGIKYKFKFSIVYSVNATTTGSAWSVNGPTVTAFAGRWTAGNATGSSLTVDITGYDTPTFVSAATPVTTANNLATIEGVIQPSANGTLIARFASEIAVASALIAKAGLSYVEYSVIG